ncbi:MAG: GTP-binding protein, partial [Cyanobacteria bacterium P01_C01_bin.72]
TRSVVGATAASTTTPDWSSKTYLANGASWGETSPKVVVQKILDSLDEQSILNRLKSELRAKLTP